jgi:hypothetical protein
VRSLVTLALFFHLFCLGLAFTTNLRMSGLQRRLLAIGAPYMQALKLELMYEPYHLTHAMQTDDDHFIEVEVEKGPRAGQKIKLPNDSFDVSAWQRYQSLARVASVNAYFQMEANAGRFARAVGAHVLSQGDEAVTVRFKRLRFQPFDYEMNEKENPADPYAAQYQSEAYAARVWRDRDGQIQVLKISAAGEAAPSAQGGRS